MTLKYIYCNHLGKVYCLPGANDNIEKPMYDGRAVHLFRGLVIFKDCSKVILFCSGDKCATHRNRIVRSIFEGHRKCSGITLEEFEYECESDECHHVKYDCLLYNIYSMYYNVIRHKLIEHSNCSQTMSLHLQMLTLAIHPLSIHLLRYVATATARYM